MAVPPIDPPPKAIIFDLDDTLCDYRAAREARLRIAFALGCGEGAGAMNNADLGAMIARSIEMHPHGADHFRELFASFDMAESAADRAAEWYRENRFHALDLFPQAMEVLRTVRMVSLCDETSAARSIGIITNGPTEVQRAKIELLGLSGLVDYVVISEEFGVAKPEPAIFEEALRLAGVASHEAVFVGDSPEFDIAGAYAAGIPTIWVNPRGDQWPGPGKEPQFELRTLAELPALVGSPR